MIFLIVFFSPVPEILTVQKNLLKYYIILLVTFYVFVCCPCNALIAMEDKKVHGRRIEWTKHVCKHASLQCLYSVRSANLTAPLQASLVSRQTASLNALSLVRSLSFPVLLVPPVLTDTWRNISDLTISVNYKLTIFIKRATTSIKQLTTSVKQLWLCVWQDVWFFDKLIVCSKQ